MNDSLSFCNILDTWGTHKPSHLLLCYQILQDSYFCPSSILYKSSIAQYIGCADRKNDSTFLTVGMGKISVGGAKTSLNLVRTVNL